MEYTQLYDMYCALKKAEYVYSDNLIRLISATSFEWHSAGEFPRYLNRLSSADLISNCNKKVLHHIVLGQ